LRKISQTEGRVRCGRDTAGGGPEQPNALMRKFGNNETREASLHVSLV